jgi:hypothetical protein
MVVFCAVVLFDDPVVAAIVGGGCGGGFGGGGRGGSGGSKVPLLSVMVVHSLKRGTNPVITKDGSGSPACPADVMHQ